MPTGIELIAAERQRQIEKEGWTHDHDEEHKMGELTEAAKCYATVGAAIIRGSSAEEWPVSMFDGFNDSIVEWPWEDESWKPAASAERNLIKAGALIAAELDRLHRRAATPSPQG